MAETVLFPTGGGSRRRWHEPDPDDPEEPLCPRGKKRNYNLRERSRSGIVPHYEQCQACAGASADGGAD